jgi:hypothetical protein
VPATIAWDETKPLGSELASTIDNIIRDLKRDLRERLAVDHVWGVAVDLDGFHRQVTLAPIVNVTPIKMSQGNTLAGTTAGGIFDTTQQWGTSGVGTGFKMNIDLVSAHVDSALMDLKVNGVTKFKIDMNGNVIVGSIPGGSAGGGNVNSSADFGADDRLIKSDGGGKNVQATAITVNDVGDVSGIRTLTYLLSQAMGRSAKNVNTVYTAPCDGFLLVRCDAVVGQWEGMISVYCDAFATPTTLVGRAGMNTVIDKYATLCIPIIGTQQYLVTPTVNSGTLSVGVDFYPLGFGGI